MSKPHRYCVQNAEVKYPLNVRSDFSNLFFQIISAIICATHCFRSTGVWRNGSASDSRSEDWEFESLCPHLRVRANANHLPDGGLEPTISFLGGGALSIRQHGRVFELQFCFSVLVVLLVKVFGAAVIVWGGYSAFRCEFLVFCSLACVCVAQLTRKKCCLFAIGCLV